MIVPISIAEDGKPAHQRLWALVQMETRAEIRDTALSLWLDMRERQEGAGYKPTAAVWVDSHRLQPTSEEVAAFKAKPLKKLDDVLPVVEEEEDPLDALDIPNDTGGFELDF